jgi:predicted RNA methylase
MLLDKVRCESYKNAIEAIVKGKTVLDVGAGTGFLSVIAAKAGASHVYAVEYSEMADYAKQFIDDNECTDNITSRKWMLSFLNGWATSYSLKTCCPLYLMLADAS